MSYSQQPPGTQRCPWEWVFEFVFSQSPGGHLTIVYGAYVISKHLKECALLSAKVPKFSVSTFSVPTSVLQFCQLCYPPTEISGCARRAPRKWPPFLRTNMLTAWRKSSPTRLFAFSSMFVVMLHRRLPTFFCVCSRYVSVIFICPSSPSYPDYNIPFHIPSLVYRDVMTQSGLPAVVGVFASSSV